MDDLESLDMEKLNRPGTGYTPDPKLGRVGQTRFECESCGSKYVMPVKIDASITGLSSCRNIGCAGPVVRK